MIMDMAQKLNQAIRESEEYGEYRKTLAEVKAHPELYHSMNVFRRRNYDLQSWEDGVNRYNELNSLGTEFEHILREPLVNEFLIAEQAFSRAMQQMYEMVAQDLELDYDYIE